MLLVHFKIKGFLSSLLLIFMLKFQPLKTLSRQRPMANIFNAYTLLTVTLQFIVHFSCLLYIVGLAHEANTE